MKLCAKSELFILVLKINLFKGFLFLYLKPNKFSVVISSANLHNSYINVHIVINVLAPLVCWAIHV